MPKKETIYDKMVKPNLDRITQMASEGLTQNQIAESLGINIRTMKRYIEEEEELRKAISSGREVAIKEVENAMYNSAIGGKVTVKKGMKVKKTIYENGRKKGEVETVEPYDEEMYLKPDTQAGIFLLKNWAKDRYSADPIMHDLKRREVELKEKLADNVDDDFNPFS